MGVVRQSNSGAFVGPVPPPGELRLLSPIRAPIRKYAVNFTAFYRLLPPFTAFYRLFEEKHFSQTSRLFSLKKARIPA